MQYVIDTHALIWFLEGNSRLGNQATTILSAPTSILILPAIALAEALWIVERGKTSIPSAKNLLDIVNSDPRVTVYSLDIDVITQTLVLPSINEMHDRQIVATAIVIQNKGNPVSLLTRDQNIIASGVISIVW